ncbi:hypothetical protein ACFL54_04630 [Planctomycetota bacterium]
MTNLFREFPRSQLPVDKFFEWQSGQEDLSLTATQTGGEAVFKKYDKKQRFVGVKSKEEAAKHFDTGDGWYRYNFNKDKIFKFVNKWDSPNTIKCIAVWTYDTDDRILSYNITINNKDIEIGSFTHTSRTSDGFLIIILQVPIECDEIIIDNMSCIEGGGHTGPLK